RKPVLRGVPDQGHADPGRLRAARPRGDEHAVEARGVGEAHPVARPYVTVGAEPTEVLDDRVDEAVVVVHHEHTGRGHTPSGGGRSAGLPTIGRERGTPSPPRTVPAPHHAGQRLRY